MTSHPRVRAAGICHYPMMRNRLQFDIAIELNELLLHSYHARHSMVAAYPVHVNKHNAITEFAALFVE
jgi:hypothetical protein